MNLSLLLDTDLSKTKIMLNPITFESLTDKLKEELAIQQAFITDRLGQSEEASNWLNHHVIFLVITQKPLLSPTPSLPKPTVTF